MPRFSRFRKSKRSTRRPRRTVRKHMPFKRYRKVANRVNMASLPATGFPRTLAVKLRYSEVDDLTAAIGAADTWVLRCNSLFDPDFTNVGHQPYYFDELSALYKRYRVNAIGWRAEFTNLSATVPAYVGYTYSNDSNSVTSLSTLCEAGDGLFRTLNVAGAGSGSSTVMKGYAKIKDLVGQNIDQSDMQANTTADPALSHFLKFCAQDATTGAGTVDVSCRIILMFYATMFSVDEVSPS